MPWPNLASRLNGSLALLVAASAFGCSGADPGEVTFFVSSSGSDGKGGDLGGVAAADQKCSDLASAAGFTGHSWAAYLSTADENARDRIGSGPWVNTDGEEIAADVGGLHSDGVLAAHKLDEDRAFVPETEHDVITGSLADGTFDATTGNCADYTSSDSEMSVVVGHTDGEPAIWANAHPTPCSAEGMQGNNGAGRIYCFGF